eukprot:121111-Chlamydomonas_euryale.AAC.1
MLLTLWNVTHPAECYSSSGMLLTQWNVTHPAECYSPSGMLLTQRNVTHPAEGYSSSVGHPALVKSTACRQPNGAGQEKA